MIFFIILKFIFTPIFEIKIYEKKFLDAKNISFSKSEVQHIFNLSKSDLLMSNVGLFFEMTSNDFLI